jgi:plastocyanin
VGDSVTFTIGSDEPHTVTFGAGPADVPPPFWPVAGFAEPSEEAAAAPPMTQHRHHDGSAFVPAFLSAGAPRRRQFETAGTFPFFCALHEGAAAR